MALSYWAFLKQPFPFSCEFTRRYYVATLWIPCSQYRNLLKSCPRQPPTSVLHFLLCKRFHLPTNVRCQGSVLTAEAKLRSLERSETEAFATGEQGGKGCEVDLIGLIWFLSGNNSQRQSFSWSRHYLKQIPKVTRKQVSQNAHPISFSPLTPGNFLTGLQRLKSVVIFTKFSHPPKLLHSSLAFPDTCCKKG